MTSEITLCEFSNSLPNGVSHLWFSSTYQVSTDLLANLDDDGEDYCNLVEVFEEMKFSDLVGEVTDGRWVWSGTGSPTDYNRNQIQKMVAR